MRLRSIRAQVLGVFLAAAAAAACGGGGEQASSAPAAAPAAPAGGQRVDAATAGSVKGTVTLDGTAPANEPIRMNADPVCVKEAKGPQTQHTYLVTDGKVANVFVYVKDGLGNFVYDAPTDAVVLDQKGCRYSPHVFGVRVGQALEIVNSDPTLHNIHALPKANPEFNEGQPVQGMKSRKTFNAKEVMVPFKCDVHGWMNAYAGVVDHPYYAVTGTDGSFELKSVPPGTYTIEAWHERLGASTQSVTLGPSESKDVSFTFKASAAATTN